MAARPHRRGTRTRACLRPARPPGPYQLQAAIAAVHTDAPTFGDTDWPAVIALYDQLLVVAPTPVVELNRAVAIAEVSGAEAGLAIVDGLDLAQWHLYHATRGELLARLGRTGEARGAYGQALELVTNDAERRHLEARLAALG